MPLLLPTLLVPLLACVALLPGHRGAASARVILAAFALASLQVGTGSLVPFEMQAWAGQGPSQQLFVSLTIGIALGGLGLWSRRGWLWHLAAAPLGVGLLVLFWAHLRIAPLLLGAVLGAVPLLLGGLAPRFMSVPVQPASTIAPINLLIVVIACGAMLSRSLVAIALVPLLPLLESSQRAPAVRRQLVMPALAFLLLLAFVAYAISLASSPAMVFTSLGFDAPLPGAVERVVGATALAVAICMVAPWPLHRLGPGATLVPAAALLAYLVAGSIAPLGVAGWLPLAAVILVPSAIAAAWRGYWANALGSLSLLAVPRPGWLGLGIVVLLAGTAVAVSVGNRRPPDRISFPNRTLAAVTLAMALALATSAVLAHEVVLGSLLAVGMATALARPVIGPPPP